MEQKARTIAEENNMEPNNIFTQLITREKQREAARRIKIMMGKLKGRGVTRVEIAHQDGRLEELTTKNGIEKACMLVNDKKYKQTKNTPCMQEPLRSVLGFCGDSPTGRAILEGTYRVPADILQYTAELFTQLKRAELITEPPKAIIFSENFKKGWGKIKEQTSAGISGIHFGHMKSCVKDRMLTDFESSLCHIPYTTSHSPEKWKYNISVIRNKLIG